MAAKDILSSYSPEDVVMVLSNDRFSHHVRGFADGSFITLSRLIPHATLYNGADGTNARVVRNIKNYDITVTLHQAAETNDVLNRLIQLDSQSRDGSDVFSLTLKDNTGRTVLSSPAAFIGTQPDQDFGVEISERAWVISAIYLDGHIGGNGRFSEEGQDDIEDLGYSVPDRWKAQ